MKRVLAGLTLGLLAACADEPQPGLDLEPLSYRDISGWHDADLARALRAFERSCGKIDALPTDRPMGTDGIAGSAGEWQAVCADLTMGEPAAQFFEGHFQPYRVRFDENTEGLFTGYYEPLLFGAREPGGAFVYPIRSKPKDMVRVDLSAFHKDFKGRRIVGHIQGDRLVPYPERADIDAGAIDKIAEPWLWVNDKIDKFFLQIQGSGLVELPNGETVRVGYDGQNGRAYRAIGRDLIDMGELTRENVSLQTIRRWLIDNPDRADTLMHRNASYVFFRELSELKEASGPLGSQNVPLEPEHSLAVDRSFWPMGLPVWLALDVQFEDGTSPWRQLLIAQDTGGAIKGAIRGDVFWGAGTRAEFVAGHMKANGDMIVLLPKSLAPAG